MTHRTTLALGAVIAAAMPSTASAQGTLSVSPAIVETTARTGATVATTIANTTGTTMRIRVAARPWRQARNGGAVSANRKRTLRGVRLNTTRFTLAAGARRAVTATLRRVPARGSRFAALDIAGTPVTRRRGVKVRYRLVSSLRFNPASKRFALRTGGVRTRGRTLSLLVRNAGNGADPVGGRVTITGPGGGRSATLGAVRILPGKLVALPAASLRGLRPGRYTARFTLRQGGRKRASATRSFRIRR